MIIQLVSRASDQTKKSDEHRVTGSSDFFFCHPKSPFDTNIICSGTTLDIILFLAVDYAERTIPFFLRTARAIALTNSTIGIMENASAMAMAYSVPSSFAVDARFHVPTNFVDVFKIVFHKNSCIYR